MSGLCSAHYGEQCARIGPGRDCDLNSCVGRFCLLAPRCNAPGQVGTAIAPSLFFSPLYIFLIPLQNFLSFQFFSGRLPFCVNSVSIFLHPLTYLRVLPRQARCFEDFFTSFRIDKNYLILRSQKLKKNIFLSEISSRMKFQNSKNVFVT